MIYILVAVVAVGSLPADKLAGSDAPLADALDDGAGIELGGRPRLVGALIAITSVILDRPLRPDADHVRHGRDGLRPERLGAG